METFYLFCRWSTHTKLKLLKKSEFVIRHLPDLHNKFESVLVLRTKLVESLGEQVPRLLSGPATFQNVTVH